MSSIPGHKVYAGVMASTDDMLQTTLGNPAYRALNALADCATPMSGRMVAAELGVSPTTATKALSKLREAGFAASSRQGRANRWNLNMDNAVLRSWLAEARIKASAAKPAAGVSPYATGGGGVTFERKVAVQYLTHLLVGDGAVEFGDGRLAVSVAFQQAPEHSVDDLVVRAACVDEVEPSLVLAVAVRRSPDLVQSDQPTKDLIRALLREVISAPVDGPEHRVALVVAGLQDHAAQLASLAGLASMQMDAPGFFKLARTPRKFSAAIRERLAQLEALVGLALIDLGVAEPSEHLIQQRTWDLLSRLKVLMPRLEVPDEADWAAVANALIPAARGTDLYGASQLRDRLVALADEYAPKAATVDMAILRRDAHQVLDATTRRHQQGWRALDHLQMRAIAAVRDEIVSGDGGRAVHVDRSDAAAELLALAGSANAALVVHGGSGVGKSALVAGAVAAAMSGDPDTTQAVSINLRHLPDTSLALESHLGTPLATLLAELSAPRRLLVIDGADAMAEGKLEPLRYLVDAGLQADVKVIAVAADDSMQLLRDTMAERSGGKVAEFLVPPLTDAEVQDVVATFGELATLAANTRSRELLRRLVVVDLLVRGGLAGTPLSDADAMRQVWSGLVRRHEQSDRGTPDARELALLHLANFALCGGKLLDVVGTIDPTALDGLRHDGLLRTSPEDPFRIGPEFAHDEVRRYAVARLLLAEGNGDTTSKLLEGSVPRWALSAARLACQALLASPDTSSNPLRGRFAHLQRAFDELVEAGHGDRWGDVPGEALLTLGDPGPVLRDAWSELDAAPDGRGLQRLCRLVDQRLRDENGLVRIGAVEPIISLLLNDETPWRSGDHVQGTLRDWLRALVIADKPSGHALRVRLRDRLLAASAAADRRLQEEREAAAAARAARSAEEVEAERKFMESHKTLFTEIGWPHSRRRQRTEVPHEIADEIVVELLALLGPDLGEDGEKLLRRVARDAPWQVGPAVEALFAGRALAAYRPEFLAELTEAYYLDEDEDGTSSHEDGIRDHNVRGFGVTPLTAWYRGPFMVLFQSAFRSGVPVLNRMLNHAALARARTLANLDQYGASVEDDDLNVYQTELDITGTRRTYVGDEHVWLWYRGTGVGPYPCMSALQALERVCDQLIEIGIPVSSLVSILLDGCENLAMVGLAVGLLMRHLERADRVLDPYLTEPLIWELEFSRVIHENTGLAATSDGMAAPERRQWSMRDAAMWMVVHADDARADELRLIGQRLVSNARRLIEEALDVDAAAVEEQLVTVRSWASGLDRSTYKASETEDGLLIQSTPPDDITRALESGTVDVRRAQEFTRLIVRYYVNSKRGTAETIGAEDLAADLATAQELVEDPPAFHAGDRWDAPTAVAAAALKANLIHGVHLPDDALRFAAETVLRGGSGKVAPQEYESEESYFEQGANRSAARALPLLLSPCALGLRALVDGGDGSGTYKRATAAGVNLARSVANEARVHLARGLDRLWEAPCTTGGTCHHETALRLAIETMRDSAFGEWRQERGQRDVVELDDPIADSLAATADDAIYSSRLDAAIRALAPAAMARICVSVPARDLLATLLAAHRRSLLAHEQDIDHRGTHALIAARALLTIAAEGEDDFIFEHINAFSDNPTQMAHFLRALSSAAEESQDRAATALRIWPAVVAHVVGLQESGHAPFVGRYYGDYALAALMPNAAGEVSYLYREVENELIVWWEPLAWQSTVELWLPIAQGNPTCVDQLIGFMAPMPAEDQARVGLQWVASLVLADPERVADRTFLLSSWLIEGRQAASDAGLLSDWQRIVDALVVAGVSRLAPYSE